MMKQIIQVISAPSILGLQPTGVEMLPESLLNAGIVKSIHAADTIIYVATLNNEYDFHRDLKTNCLNTASINTFSLLLMNEISNQLDQSRFPVVLGGDCSILIGIMPALKARGNYGLLFLDAHADFYQPEKSTTVELADMDLAVVTGHGPDILTNINDLQPYVEEKNVIHIGQRDAEEADRYGSQKISETAIRLFDFAMIESVGINKVATKVTRHMQQLDVSGFWIHFDTDVINDKENPAVDYRLPGGLSFEDTGLLLGQLLQTGKIAGMSIAIFNPSLDPGGTIAEKIVACLARSFKS